MLIYTNISPIYAISLQIMSYDTRGKIGAS